MTVIERQHIEDSIALSEDFDRSVGESNLKTGMTSKHHESCSHVLSAEGRS